MLYSGSDNLLTSALKIRGSSVIAGALLLLLAAISDNVPLQASGLDSMSSIAISYGENGPVFCGLKSDGSHLVSCYGSNSAIIYGTPAHFPFLGITAGDGFVCGLLLKSNQPYCWGNNNYIQMGVPQPMNKGAQYSEISAGDNHLCGLRIESVENTSSSFVDCWGYNMTSNMVFEGKIMSISAGSEFNCALFSQNRSVFCWGDETSSRVITLIPKNTRFQIIAAGGYHVCGILEGVDSRVSCWGRSLDMVEEISSVRKGNVAQAPTYPMLSVVGGKFHACGIRSFDRGVVCWGFQLAKSSTRPPSGIKMYEIAAGDYFTCGVVADKSLSPICWGSGFPTSIPLAVSPGLCKSRPCNPGFYEFNSPEGVTSCSSSSSSPDSRICLPCSNPCSRPDMHLGGQCSDALEHNDGRHCALNCTGCASAECFSNCTNSGDPAAKKKKSRFWAVQLPAIVAEACFAVFWVCVVCLTAALYLRHRLRHCSCSSVNKRKQIKKKSGNYDDSKEMKMDDHQLKKISRAQQFTYEELQKATGGFKEESIVGKGSFSCVFKGVLKDGTEVAVKRAILSSDVKKNSKEFHTELDLLSRLNHAHLLNLLGYCEEGGERLLVYEFMAHGSLHQHLHSKNKTSKEQLDWIRRVTIAVQAARGIEYLHGYACPPVIHRDIKSSNILIDEEHNARVSDFGLSLLGPTDSSSPLAELPAGTLGYLDPEYYRLHYLTTKSDVYSFGVLLLEILSGRKAIDMQFEEGNIVQWAVPLIKSGDISAILDPVLKPPADLEALIRIANVACKCVRMRGKDRPSMEIVTTALERALALLMGTPCSEQPILPTEVVLGSSRMHKKSSQRSSNRSSDHTEEVTTSADQDLQRFEFRAPSWITFPSVASSQRRKSSVSDADLEARNCAAAAAATGESRNPALTERNNNSSNNNNGTEGLRSLEEEIGPASPQESLFLKHNF